MTRQYKLKRRAERQDETRQRIVDATIELHQTIGPAATTISQIAERAGVGRVTVYRHFPDELTLASACSGQYFQRNPAPDPDNWRAIDNPGERLRSGLRDTYAYHRATEQMMTHVLADARANTPSSPPTTSSGAMRRTSSSSPGRCAAAGGRCSAQESHSRSASKPGARSPTSRVSPTTKRSS